MRIREMATHETADVLRLMCLASDSTNTAWRSANVSGSAADHHQKSEARPRKITAMALARVLLDCNSLCIAYSRS